jgi:hypothetical protein
MTVMPLHPSIIPLAVGIVEILIVAAALAAVALATFAGG